MPARSPQRTLSKSKVMAFRQCPRRMWLEIHHPDLAETSASAEARFRTGDAVGELARRLFDANGRGTLVNPRSLGYPEAIRRTRELLEGSAPIFEATFSAAGGLALADVMLPAVTGKHTGWRMIEVKSSTQVKPYHLEDVAIQAYVARQAGVKLDRVDVAHIDSTWVYQGDGDYSGLLGTVEVTRDVLELGSEVREWITAARGVACAENEPDRRTGAHCHTPFDCPFLKHCRSTEPQPKHDAHSLPRIQKAALRSLIEGLDPAEIVDVPDCLLNRLQRRVKACTLSGDVFFDAEGAAADLQECQLPAVFLDFETVSPAIPRWRGTRPYQQIPFQLSAHVLHPSMQCEHHEFLDLTASDPRAAFVASLRAACGDAGPIFVFNATLEKTRIKELAEQFPDARSALLAIHDRVFDLLPVARERYYHPDQRGSWSIKHLLPCIAPALSYELLDGISEGGAAMDAYVEATSPDTGAARKTVLEQQLLAYCGRDTEALVHLWAYLSGRDLAGLPSQAPTLASPLAPSGATTIVYGNMDWWEPEEGPDDFSALPKAFSIAKSLWEKDREHNAGPIADLLLPYVRARFIPGNARGFEKLFQAQPYECFEAMVVRVVGIDYSRGCLPSCRSEAWFKVPVVPSFTDTDIEDWEARHDDFTASVVFYWAIPDADGSGSVCDYSFGDNSGVECVIGWDGEGLDAIVSGDR